MLQTGKKKLKKNTSYFTFLLNYHEMSIEKKTLSRTFCNKIQIYRNNSFSRVY